MSSNWQSFTIEEIAAKQDSSISIGPFGSRMKSDCYVEKGIPVIRGNNISEGLYPDGEFVFVDEEKAREVRSAQVFGGDLVFPHRGAIGRVALVRNSTQMILSSSLMKLTPDKERCSSEFLFYFFRSKNGIYELLKNSSTVGTPGIGQPLTSLKSIPVQLPPLLDQKAIAHILGTLDEKIELNKWTNETLEGIAKALFKSWFIDFDPVRAKAEGLSTGLSDEISELFPDSFEDSELGGIPSGWRLDFLSNHLSITKGRSYKSIELRDSPNALVTLKSFLRGGGYRADGLKPYTGTYKEDQIVSAGELVIALTDVTQSADVIGRPAIVRRNESYKQLIASLDVGILRVQPEGSITKEYAFELLKTVNYVSHALSYTSGTTVLHLGKGVLESFQVVIPNLDIVERFTYFSSEIHEKIDMNENCSRNLVKLRDALLPKLISGELRVPDAEKMLEEVGI